MIEYVANDQRLTAEAFVALAQQVWPRAYDTSQVALALTRTSSVSAWQDGRLVGCVRVLTDGYFFATIPEILVHPDSQRQGIGRELMKRALILAVLCSAAFVAQARGNAESGKAKAAQVCAACHGPDGNKPSAPDQPILAGQHYDYLVRALTDYKIGRRNNPIMKGFAAQLSKQDIEDLAAWFSSQKSHLHDQR